VIWSFHGDKNFEVGHGMTIGLVDKDSRLYCVNLNGIDDWGLTYHVIWSGLDVNLIYHVI